MTQKVQDINDLKGQNVQDIDYPIHVINNLILLNKLLDKGGIRWNKNSEKQPLNVIWKEKLQNQYIQILNVQKTGFSSGSSATKAENLNGTMINQELQ